MWCLLLAKVFTAIIATLLVVDQASKSVGLNLYDTLTLSMNTPTSSVVVIPNDNARVNFAASEPVILANDTQHVFVELKPTDPLQKSRSDKQWEFLKLKTREMLIVLSSAVARLVSVIEFYIGFVTERLPGYPFNVQNLEEFRRFLHQKVDNDQQRIYLSPKSFRSLITMIAFQLRQSLIRIITNLLTIVKAVLGLTFHFSSFVVLLVTCARYCHSVISKHEDYVTDLEASYKELVSQLKSSHRRSVAILRVSYAGYMTSLESRYKEMLVELHSSHEKVSHYCVFSTNLTSHRIRRPSIRSWRRLSKSLTARRPTVTVSVWSCAQHTRKLIHKRNLLRTFVLNTNRYVIIECCL